MSRSTNWCGLSPTSRRSTCGRETPLGCWWVVARFSSIALHDPAAPRRPPPNGTQCSAPRRSGLRGRSRSHPTVRAWLAGRRSWGRSRRRRLRERTRPRWSPRPGAVGRLEGIRWYRPTILLTAVWSSSSVTETQYRGRRSAGSGVSSRQTGMILSPSSSRRMIAVSNSDLTHSDVLARSDQQTSTVSTVSKATPTLPGNGVAGAQFPLIEPDVHAAQPQLRGEGANGRLVLMVVGNERAHCCALSSQRPRTRLSSR